MAEKGKVKIMVEIDGHPVCTLGSMTLKNFNELKNKLERRKKEEVKK